MWYLLLRTEECNTLLDDLLKVESLTCYVIVQLPPLIIRQGPAANALNLSPSILELLEVAFCHLVPVNFDGEYAEEGQTSCCRVGFYCIIYSCDKAHTNGPANTKIAPALRR